MTPRGSKHIALLVAACIALLAPCHASAEDSAKAKEHFLKGKALVGEGALDKAIIEFKKSYEYNPVSVVLYNIAICYDELKKYANAIQYYQKFLDADPEMPEDKRLAIEGRIAKLKIFLGSLSLEIEDENVEIIIDGESIGTSPLPEEITLETGVHILKLRKEGLPDLEQKFTIVSGEATEIYVPKAKPAVHDVKAEEQYPEEEETVEIDEEAEVDLAALDSLDLDAGGGKGRRKIGKAPFIAGVALTGASFVTAIITGTLALKTEKEFHEQYIEDEDEWRPLKRKAENLALGTDVLIGLGSAFAAATVILVFFTDFKGESRGELSFAPLMTESSGGIYVAGTF